MVALQDHRPRNNRPYPNLLLHCGATRVERQQVAGVPTPRPTAIWTPIPHLELVTHVERTLRANNLFVGVQAHSLTHDGARYFGLMEIQRRETDEDYCWVLGLRNSHDKTFPAGIVAGSQVFCCDNLAFSGEVKLARKHTRFITRDLPQLVQSAVGKLMNRWHHQDSRLATYKLAELEDGTAHDLVIRATDVGVCPNKLILRVLHEWRESRHEAFEARNVGSLFNAFTEALKGNLLELPRRTERSTDCSILTSASIQPHERANQHQASALREARWPTDLGRGLGGSRRAAASDPPSEWLRSRWQRRHRGRSR